MPLRNSTDINAKTREAKSHIDEKRTPVSEGNILNLITSFPKKYK